MCSTLQVSSFSIPCGRLAYVAKDQCVPHQSLVALGSFCYCPKD